jgi:transposase
MAKTEYAQTQLMRQIPGVGVITSVAFTLTIENPHRFGKSRDIAGWSLTSLKFSPSRQMEREPEILRRRAKVVGISAAGGGAA